MKKRCRSTKNITESLIFLYRIYTDSDLQNLDQIFEEMQQYLKPEHENRQILEATLEEFKRFSL